MKILNRSKKLGISGFSHFEMVLVIIVVALIAASGIYIFNFNKNKSSASSQVFPGGTYLMTGFDVRPSGIAVAPGINGCQVVGAQGATTKYWWGKLEYTALATKPKEPTAKLLVSTVDDIKKAQQAAYDLTISKNTTGYVTYIYSWATPVNSFYVYIVDNNNKLLEKRTVNINNLTNCGDLLNKGLAIKSLTPAPATPAVSAPKPAPTPTPTATGGGTAPLQTPPATVVKKYPRTYDNFTRVHHMYKVVKDKNGKDITRASNYDIFWKDSSKQILIVQYRVNVVSGSGLIPGLFYSNVYLDKPISGNGEYNKKIRIASFAISNPVNKTEYSSPLQKASPTVVKNNLKKTSAVPGRYWGEVHITRKQMKGKNILYFNAGYDSTRKLTEKPYAKSQAYDVNKAGWLNKVPGEKQPMIRK
ncbi:hypothetical protein EBZ57_00975 [bacterium]|nr:hypothetical protein [bacterium]